MSMFAWTPLELLGLGVFAVGAGVFIVATLYYLEHRADGDER